MNFEVEYSNETNRTVTGVENEEMALEVSKELSPKGKIIRIYPVE